MGKKIICIEDGTLYKTMGLAASAYKIDASYLWDVLDKRNGYFKKIKKTFAYAS